MHYYILELLILYLSNSVETTFNSIDSAKIFLKFVFLYFLLIVVVEKLCIVMDSSNILVCTKCSILVLLIYAVCVDHWLE